MSDPAQDEEIDIYDLNKQHPDGLGDVAKSEYVRLLNQGRSHVALIPDPTGKPFLTDKTPAKWAVLRILTKKKDLTLKDIETILAGLKYKRKPTALRKALDRLVIFGLAVRLKQYRPPQTWRLVGSWQLTERGRRVSPKPSKPMTIQSRIEDALKTKTDWVFVTDLATELKLDKKQVGGALRKLRAKDKAVRNIIVTTSPRLRLWALKSVWDGNPNLGLPPFPPKAPKKTKKARTASAAPAAVNSVRRNRTMCLPNKPTLVQAITDVVNEKVAAQENFSAHDVTKALREKLNKSADAVSAGLATWPIDTAETGTVYVNGHSIPKVEHDDVREVMSHLWNTGAMSSYQRTSNGQYMEYSPAVVAAPPDPSTSSADPSPAPTSSTPYDGSSTI